MQTCSTDNQMAGETHQPSFSPQIHSRRNIVRMVRPPSDETQSKLFYTCSYLCLIAFKTAWRKELFKLYLSTQKCHHSIPVFHFNACVYINADFFIYIFSFSFEALEWAVHGKHVTAHETNSHQNDLHLDNGFRGLCEGIVEKCTHKHKHATCSSVGFSRSFSIRVTHVGSNGLLLGARAQHPFGLKIMGIQDSRSWRME